MTVTTMIALVKPVGKFDGDGDDILSSLLHPPLRSSLLSKPFLILISWQAVMLASLGLGAYLWALQRYGPGAHSRTVALFALVGVQLGHMFNCRSRSRSALNGLFRNKFIWVAAIIVILLQLLAAYLSPLSELLGTVKPLPLDWAMVVSCTLLTIVIVEIAKLTFRRRQLAG